MGKRFGGKGGVGSKCPGLDLCTPEGDRRTLQQCSEQPVLVSFLGPAHCLFCRAHVIRLIQARREIDSLGAKVILVTYHDPELMTAKMLHDLDVPYTLLLDPTRTAYEQWGLGRVGLWGMITPMLWAKSIRIMMDVMRGREQSLGSSSPGGTPQRGGDFVVNCDRAFVFANRMTSFHDRPKIADLLAALRTCQLTMRSGSVPVWSPPAAAPRS
jgi:peroxiredoxin